ncbi:MAG: linear amide C-N hydrolase [PVC group bacterium]
MKNLKQSLPVAAALVLAVGAGRAEACSDIFVSGGAPKVSARNLDWATDNPTLITISPRGTFRKAAPYQPGDNPASWRSRYGTVTSRMFTFGIYVALDGMNEHGLSGGLLMMVGTRYPGPDPRPFVSDDAWMLYFLDNCRDVAEAVALAPTVRAGGVVPQHLVLHDPSGDSAVLECVDGELKIYRPPEYNGVMTNEPPYPDQLANLANYQGFGGDLPLPGDTAAESRFVRASWYLQTLPVPQTAGEAFAGARAIIRNVAKPLVPGVSHTVWTAFRGHTDLNYNWYSFYLPDLRYLDVGALDVTEGNPVTVLDLYADLTGEVSGYFKPDPSRLRLASGDYNGDGTSEIAVFRSRCGLWAVRGITRVYFGGADDLPVPGDYDGDGTADIGIYRGGPGLWAIRDRTREYFGGASSRPVPADYDGDGSCDIAVFRESTSLWAVKGVSRVYFGAGGDVPVPGDYDGDGSSEIGIFRGAAGLWAVKDLSRFYFGIVSDTPLPADYDGDGTGDPAVFGSVSVFSFDGLWTVRGMTRKYFGRAVDLPVPADYDGDGRDDTAVFRAGSGLWAVPGVTRVYHGTSWDIPVTR